MSQCETATIHITATESAGTATIATLSDGRVVIARNCGDRWTGKMVDVSDFDPQRMLIGELVTLRSGTSRRLALDEAIDKMNA